MHGSTCIRLSCGSTCIHYYRCMNTRRVYIMMYIHNYISYEFSSYHPVHSNLFNYFMLSILCLPAFPSRNNVESTNTHTNTVCALRRHWHAPHDIATRIDTQTHQSTHTQSVLHTFGRLSVCVKCVTIRDIILTCWWNVYATTVSFICIIHTTYTERQRPHTHTQHNFYTVPSHPSHRVRCTQLNSSPRVRFACW